MKVGEFISVIRSSEGIEIIEPDHSMPYQDRVDGIPGHYEEREIDHVETSAYTDESVFIAIYLTAKED